MTYAERLAEFVKTTGSKPGEMNKVSLEPPAQSAGPGRCNRYVNVARGFASPCVLDAGHEGAHEL